MNIYTIKMQSTRPCSQSRRDAGLGAHLITKQSQFAAPLPPNAFEAPASNKACLAASCARGLGNASRLSFDMQPPAGVRYSVVGAWLPRPKGPCSHGPAKSFTAISIFDTEPAIAKVWVCRY